MSKAGNPSKKPEGAKPYPPEKPPSRAGSPKLSDIDKIHQTALLSLPNVSKALLDHILSLPAGDKRTEFITKKFMPGYTKPENRKIIRQAWPEIPNTPAPSRPSTPPPKTRK